MNNRKKIRKALLFISLLAIPILVFSQPEIPVDASLAGNSDSWKVKTKQQGFIHYRPAEVFFGPVRTISTSSDKSEELSREVNRDLFWKNIKTVNSRQSSMRLVYQEADTAEVDLLAVTIDEIHKRNAVGVIVRADKNEDETIASNSWIDEMIIRLQSDTVQWRYTKTDSASFQQTGYIGKLQSPGDSFFVKPVDNYSGKRMKDRLFTVPATGFVFLKNGKQVAAFQVSIRKNAWMAKDIDGSAKEAILVTMAALFATINAETGEGI